MYTIHIQTIQQHLFLKTNVYCFHYIHHLASLSKTFLLPEVIYALLDELLSNLIVQAQLLVEVFMKLS